MLVSTALLKTWTRSPGVKDSGLMCLSKAAFLTTMSAKDWACAEVWRRSVRRKLVSIDDVIAAEMVLGLELGLIARSMVWALARLRPKSSLRGPTEVRTQSFRAARASSKWSGHAWGREIGASLWS